MKPSVKVNAMSFMKDVMKSIVLILLVLVVLLNALISTTMMLIVSPIIAIIFTTFIIFYRWCRNMYTMPIMRIWLVTYNLTAKPVIRVATKLYKSANSMYDNL